MERIERIIKQNIKNHKIEDKIKVYEAVSLWESVVVKLLPEAVGKTMALTLERGILKVAALTRDVAEMIITLQSRIIYELNQRIGRQLVYRISCEM